jgi:probable addiction module antidote protein
MLRMTAGKPKTITRLTSVPFSVSDHLKTEREIVVYWQDMLADGDPSSVAIALRTVSETIGMTELARRTGLAREALYKILAKDGNPTVWPNR